jgi:ABC-type proline/glycine betaine transport system permease subunit
MENLDIILMTAVVVILYAVFLGNTFSAFSSMVDKAEKENKEREK